MQKIAEREYRGPERRRDKRRDVTLPGRIRSPEKGEEADCILINISPGGAAVLCARSFRSGAEVVLDIERLGLFEGRALESAGPRLSIHFDQSERARKRAMERIALFRQGRAANSLDARVAQPLYEALMSKFTWSDGRSSECEIVDISLNDASLKTHARPPLDDVIRIGLSSARVVRYDDEGIGVAFISGVPR